MRPHPKLRECSPQQSLAWLLLVFVLALIAYVVVRGLDLRRVSNA